MSGLRGAIDALRRALGPAQAARGCPSCGPDSPQTTRVLRPGDLALSCPACGRALDPDGQGIGSLIYTLTILTDAVQPPSAH